MKIEWSGNDHDCYVKEGYLYIFFARKGEKASWHMVGSLHHFINNADYQMKDSEQVGE